MAETLSVAQNAQLIDRAYPLGGAAMNSAEKDASRETRLRYDLTTYFAETVNGVMRTEFALELRGNDLYGEDGSSMDKITKDSLVAAKDVADLEPALAFESRRRQHEREEFEEIREMAKGKGPNAMVVVSDFPAELMSAKEDVGGYNVTRKQTMLRVLTRDDNGRLRMYSQSLDQSNRLALEAIYKSFGIEPEPGELLGQRIRANVDPKFQPKIVDKLTSEYDQEMTKQFGGEWHAGRRPVDYRNTYDFVLRQTDLIDECIRLDKLGWMNDDFMYSISATMQERFDKDAKGEKVQIKLSVGDTEKLHQEIIMAGLRAAADGVVFSGCGVSQGSRGGSRNRFDSVGYGNSSITENSGDCEFVSKSCPSCKAENVKTTVRRGEGGRHVSGSCGCSKFYPD